MSDEEQSTFTEDRAARPAELAKAYDPSAIEQKWAAYWVSERLFDTPAGEAGKKPFTLLLPPPNVTGRLHMGHMLNQTEMDILTRWHRMRGEQALWVPGTDHAGIATQMMVEKQLAVEGKTTRKELGREAFTERVWAWKRQYGSAITDQMRRLGASVDWSREYFTMDDGLSSAVIEAFVRLYEQGLIYRGAYIVNWDPVLQSAVSDLEVVHEERAGKLFHVRYPLADGSGSIVVATTRPETMLGDVAVAVNPADKRYKALVGQMLVLPLSETHGAPARQIRILADEWAQPEFGTGAVKVTPAHDPNDFALGQRHGLPSPSIFDTAARVTLPGSKYDGLDRYAARARIVADLDALGLLVAVKDHPMSVGLSQRSGADIEPRLSDQWFLKIQPLADKAVAAVKEGHIRFTPEMYTKTYFDWMGNIHDWCLSRQLWWGHRIPAWFCDGCKSFCVARSAPERCGDCGSDQLTQETDVLDTWFSSGLLPFTVFGWPGAAVADAGAFAPTADMAAFYPTDLLVTGFDILFFWVARMIMLGTHFMLDVPMPNGAARTLADAVPFREVYIHALVRDADRQKMSKTKGNVIDPIDIISRFGTDAVRFTLASMASPGTDIAFSEERTDGYRAFANKIWNAARFLFMNLDRAREAGYAISSELLRVPPSDPLEPGQVADETPLETRWIVSRLGAVAAEVERALGMYRFDEAAAAVYRFFWGEFCDWYLELVKLRLDFTASTNRTAEVTLGALVRVFEAALRLLSPFMPFLTEEIWHALYAQLDSPTPARSIALTRFPLPGDFSANAGAERSMDVLEELIATIRALRKELGVPEKEAAPIRLHALEGGLAELVRGHSDMLARMARVSSVDLVEVPVSGPASRSSTRFEVELVYQRQVDAVAEGERLVKELARYEKGLAAAERQLGNAGFVAKAPAAVVQGLKKQAAETRVLYDKARQALDRLEDERPQRG